MGTWRVKISSFPGNSPIEGVNVSAIGTNLVEAYRNAGCEVNEQKFSPVPFEDFEFVVSKVPNNKMPDVGYLGRLGLTTWVNELATNSLA